MDKITTTAIYVSKSSRKMKSSNGWVLWSEIKSSTLFQLSPTFDGPHESFPPLNCKPAPMVRPIPSHKFYGPDSMLLNATFLSIAYLSKQNLWFLSAGINILLNLGVRLTLPHHAQCLWTNRLNHRTEWVIQIPKNTLWAKHRTDERVQGRKWIQFSTSAGSSHLAQINWPEHWSQQFSSAFAKAHP